MSFKNLWFGIVVLSITISIIGEVQAQAVHGESSQQPGSIRRIATESNGRRAISLGGIESNGSSSNVFFNNSTGVSLANAGDTEEAHALYITTNQNFTGFVASLTVYNPTVKRGQMSRSYISIRSNESEEIAAGWVVDPWTYGDSRTRFFTYWKGAGCPNLECRNGFVFQEGAYLAPGDVLDEGNHITIKFLKDGAGNWGLYSGPGAAYLSQIGYFPASLFTGLAVQANQAAFGGCVRFINSMTSPPMGNGVFAKDNIPPGQPTPAMMTDVNFVRPDGQYYPIDSYSYRLGYLNCYGLGKFMIDDDRFVYGGPGSCNS